MKENPYPFKGIIPGIMLLLYFLLLFFLASTCRAEEMIVGYSPYCKHYYGEAEDLNEEIHLLSVSYDKFFAATFINSYNDRTVAAGYNFKTDKYDFSKLFIRGNLYLGAMYGYGDKYPNVVGISPIAAPTFEVGYKEFSIHVLVFPVVAAMLAITF